MNTKQTPEQAAAEALDVYIHGTNADYLRGYKSIIKAFQDRARLLEVLEAIISWERNNLYSSVIDKAHDSVEIAKENGEAC